jgi:hypothetical protein
LTTDESIVVASAAAAEPTTHSRQRRSPNEGWPGRLARELEELIAALDRRVPRVEEAGEAAIARDAAMLRAKAFNRLAELAGNPADGHEPDSGDPT